MFNFNQEQLQRKQMMHDLCNHPKVERHEKSFWSWFHKRNKEGFLWHNSEPVNWLQQSQNCQIMELKGYDSPFFFPQHFPNFALIFLRQVRHLFMSQISGNHTNEKRVQTKELPVRLSWTTQNNFPKTEWATEGVLCCEESSQFQDLALLSW